MRVIVFFVEYESRLFCEVRSFCFDVKGLITNDISDCCELTDMTRMCSLFLMFKSSSYSTSVNTKQKKLIQFLIEKYLLSYNTEKIPRMTDSLRSCALLHGVFVCCLHGSMVVTSPTPKMNSVTLFPLYIVHDFQDIRVEYQNDICIAFAASISWSEIPIVNKSYLDHPWSCNRISVQFGKFSITCFVQNLIVIRRISSDSSRHLTYRIFNIVSIHRCDIRRSG